MIGNPSNHLDAFVFFQRDWQFNRDEPPTITGFKLSLDEVLTYSTLIDPVNRIYSMTCKPPQIECVIDGAIDRYWFYAASVASTLGTPDAS